MRGPAHKQSDKPLYETRRRLAKPRSDTNSRPALLGRSGQWAFWTAALLTTGLSPLTLGRSGFNTAREKSVDTIAALVLFAALLALWRKVVSSRCSESEGGPSTS